MTATEIDRLHESQSVEQRIRVFAAKDGVIAHLGVREGVYVTPATNIMAIAELDQVWVLAEVFERQAAWVAPGQRAEVQLDFLPGQRWMGEVDYVYPELDPQTRTLQVRLRFANVAGDLRPNMFARVLIEGTATDPVVHVPRAAVIRGGTTDRVVLALGDGQFRAQPVALGLEAGDRVEIRSGLAAGQRVVTSGQFLIDSESNIEGALARLAPPAGSPAEAASAGPARATVAAVVREKNADARTMMLEHQPIPEWSWPVMTMAFAIDPGIDMQAVAVDAEVEIDIEIRGTRYVVTRLVPAAGAGGGQTP